MTPVAGLLAEKSTLLDPAAYSSPSPSPLQNSNGRPVTHPTYGHDAKVESGAWVEEYYDDEDEEGDEYEYDDAGLEDDEDYYILDDPYTEDLGIMWPSPVDNRLTRHQHTDEAKQVPLEPDDDRSSCLGLPLSLPYEVETLSDMDARLEYILCRLTECVKANEWFAGFNTWNSALNIWTSMGYPMKKEVKIRLIFLYYEIIFIPGLNTSFIEDRSNDLIGLLSDRALTINDLRMPWRPLYDALYNELFPHPTKLARHTVNLAPTYLNIAETAQRFFHPADVDEMLDVILPQFDPTMDSILATQTFLVHFLPIHACTKWLPLVFRMWYGLNSGLWDDQASDLLGQLAIAHVDPSRSDPRLLAAIPLGRTNTPEEEADNPNRRVAERSHQRRILDYEGKVVEDADGLHYWADPAELAPEDDRGDPNWRGIRKDIGIFTEKEFEFVMSKCLRSLNVPVGGSALSHHNLSITAADARTSKKILDAKKPIDRTQSLAEVIIYSMAEDSLIAPFGTNPAPTRSATPGVPGNQGASSDPLARVRNGGVTNMTRTGSTDSLAAAGENAERSQKYLAGSKALDHLSRLITSCETFFHPSNSGAWSVFLTSFLSHLTANFLQRWKYEEEPSCKTPVEWRLTPEIKRAFVLCLRPVALTAMFIKEMQSAEPAISTLRRLAILEPDLVMPAIMERAIPSLQGLEETQRTMSVTYAIAALAPTLSSRTIWRYGGLYIADLLTLLIPGIDLNDPTKTGLSCMAICNMVEHIRVADISEVDEAAAKAVKPGHRSLRTASRTRVEDDPNDPIGQDFEELSDEEVESRMRMSTSAFRDWVPEFLGRVLLLFSNLPEEGGKTGRAGGKTEMLTLHSVLHTCGVIFAALDEKLFDAALEQVVEYASTTTRSNAVDAVGQLVKNLSNANAPRVFDRIFPLCRQRILSELRSGASSVRTTTTSIQRPSDATLHWWLSILYGLLVPGRVGPALIRHRADYMDLLKTMLQTTYSERGWVWTGKIVEKTLSCATALYPAEMHMLNKPDRENQDFALNHTMYWGKLYRPSEALPEWELPSDEQISLGLEVIGLANEAVTTLEGLLDTRTGDLTWVNDFSRAMNLVHEVLLGSYMFIAEYSTDKTGGKAAPTYLPAEMWERLPPYKAGFVLNDPSDPRYQQVLEFRIRTGNMLQRAATIMRTAGDSDSSVDIVKLLVATIGSWLTSYGMRSKKYQSVSSAYDSLQSTKRMFAHQRKLYRSVYLAAAVVHHSNRLMTASYYRVRSELDDKLINSMLEFCLSPFVRIRRRAQSQLDSIAKTYRGTWILCFPTLFDALQPGTDPDRMKGALYVLRYNFVGLSRMSRDWNGLVEMVNCLLGAYHQTKASIQSLVTKATDELLGKMREPVVFRLNIGDGTVQAANDIVSQLQVYKPNDSIIERTSAGEAARLAHQDEQYDLLVDSVIAKSADPSLNWRYHQAAARFLYALTRRDRPTDPRLLKFFLANVGNAHPRIRDYGSAGLTRLLFQAALRTYSQGSPERLFLQEPLDPLCSVLDLTKEGPDFTDKYLAAFHEDPTDDSVLQDRLDTGWLCWGRSMEVSRFTKWDEQIFNLEPACKPALDLVVTAANDPAWWKQLADFWSQEETRNYPSANHIDLILALCQAVGRPIFDQIRPLVEGLLSDMEEKKVYDRHITRAVWEFIAGLLRGSWEWPGKDRKDFWDWFTPLLPNLFRNIRQDTVKCWDITVEYVLHEQDPRRYKPLVDFMLDTALAADFQGGSAFDLTRRVQLCRSVLRCLRWRFVSWAPRFEELFFTAFDCPYAEVRAFVASALNGLDQLHWNASYPSATALVDDVLSDPENNKDIMRVRKPEFQDHLTEIISRLKVLRQERPHGPTAMMSAHDTTAVTLMHWLSTELTDVHAVATFPMIIPILPEIFELREMNDNIEMQGIAGRLLAWITSITPSYELVEPLMRQLISILEHSTSWRTKMHCMPVLSLTYFRNLSLLSETCKATCLDVISSCLKDTNQEVREMASMTLGSFLRCSQRQMVIVLKDRFVREIEGIKLPRRTLSPGVVNPAYQNKLVELHAAVLGAVAIVEAFPYTVPKFIPPLLADTLAPRVSEPMPISASIRTCIASFKRTHEKYQERMTEDQLASMNYAQAGNSYYA